MTYGLAGKEKIGMEPSGTDVFDYTYSGEIWPDINQNLGFLLDQATMAGYLAGF